MQAHTDNQNKNLGLWLTTQVQDFLMPLGISRDTNIFNILIWQMIEETIKASDASQEVIDFRYVKSGFTLGESDTLSFNLINNLSLATREGIKKFLQSEDRLRQGHPIQVSQKRASELLTQFKARVTEMAQKQPDLFNYYRLASHKFFTASATTTLKDNTLEVMKLFSQKFINDVSRTANEQFMIATFCEFLGFVDTLLCNEKMYKVHEKILAYQVTINSFLRTLGTSDIDKKIKKHIELMDRGFTLFKDYSIAHYQSAIEGIKFERAIREDLTKLKIAPSHCSIIHDAFLSLAGLKRPDDQVQKSVTISLGAHASRLVFTFRNVTDTDFAAILHYLQKNGDKTATEGKGNAEHGSAIQVGSAYAPNNSNKKKDVRFIETDAASFIKNIYPNLKTTIGAMDSQLLEQYVESSAKYYAEKEEEKKEEEKQKSTAIKVVDGTDSADANPGLWLTIEVQNFLKKRGISRDTDIFNIIVWQILSEAIHPNEENIDFKCIKVGFTLEDAPTLQFAFPSELYDDTIENILDFFKFPRDKYRSGHTITVSKDFVDDKILSEFKARVIDLEKRDLSLFNYYRVKSNAPFASSATTALKDNALDIMRILGQKLSANDITENEYGMLRTLCEFHSIVDALLDQPDSYGVYKWIPSYQQKINSYSGSLGTSEAHVKIRVYLKQMDIGFDLFKDYSTAHYASAISGQQCIKNIVAELADKKIAASECSVIPDALLSLAGVNRPYINDPVNTSVTMNLGQNPSRLVLNFRSITDSDFAAILKYLEKTGDKTATEGYGYAVQGSSVRSSVAYAPIATAYSTIHVANNIKSRSIETDAASFFNNVYPKLKTKFNGIESELLNKYVQLSSKHFADKEKEKAKTRVINEEKQTTAPTSISSLTAPTGSGLFSNSQVPNAKPQLLTSTARLSP